jgi:hypothetical protein
MEITAVTAALLRRWYVVLLGVLVTVGLVYGVHEKVRPTYDATASVLLLPPTKSGDEATNPLFALGGLDQPSSLVVAYLTGEAATKPWAEQFPTSTRDIVVDPLSRGPIIMITVHDPSPTTVMNALHSAIDQVPAALTLLQDKVEAPAKDRVTSSPLTVDLAPATDSSKSTRAMIAALGLGAMLTLATAVSVDSLAARRRDRRAARAAAEAAAPPDEAPAGKPSGARAARSDRRRGRREAPEPPAAAPVAASEPGPPAAATPGAPPPTAAVAGPPRTSAPSVPATATAAVSAPRAAANLVASRPALPPAEPALPAAEPGRPSAPAGGDEAHGVAPDGRAGDTPAVRDATAPRGDGARSAEDAPEPGALDVGADRLATRR